MAFDRRLLLATTMIAGLALPSLAFAQDTTKKDDSQAQGQADAQSQGDKSHQVDEVVVTGSRIRRNEFTSAAPIQVITSEQTKLRGINDTGEMLQNSTVAATSGQVNGLVATGFVQTGGAGIESLSLRGLGPQRTLVLINGRRAGPAGYSGTVGPFDLGVLPTTIIDRAEILKDGASPIYGSDAVAGVVNIITRKKTDGIEIDVQGAQPFKTGGADYRASATWGKVFNRGYLNITGDYNYQQALRLKDRDYLSCNEGYRFDAAGNRVDIIDSITGKPKCFQTFSNAVQLNSSGLILQPTALYPGGVPSGFPGWEVTGMDRATTAYQYVDPRYNSWSIIPETKRATVFVTGGYDLTPSVHAYGELLLNRRSQQQDGWRQMFPVFFPGEGGNPLYFNDFAYAISEVPMNFSNTVDYGRAMGGLKGNFDLGPLHNWDWDIWGQFSRSKASYTTDVILDDALGILGDLGGSYVNNFGPAFGGCAANPVTPISNRTCVPVNFFGTNELRGIFTPAEEAFLFDRDTGHTTYDSSIVEGTIAGDLFKMPAGMVSTSVGFQFRHETIKDTPGPITLAGNSWGLSGAGITQGSDTVKEVFGEVEMPLLRDLPLIQKLTLNLSGRLSDYKSYGRNSTWRSTLNWQVAPALRFRGTIGTSFRAPALYELYLADQTSFAGQFGNDPCYHWGTNTGLNDRIKQNCAAAGVPGTYPTSSTNSIEVTTGGGIGRLHPETSKSWTTGFIWTPKFADLSVNLDYFDIEVDNQVAQFGPGNILFGCYNSPNFPSDPLCSLFHRDMTAGSPTQYQVTSLNDSYINIASQRERGLDLTVQYRRNLPWDTRMTVNQQVTWMLQDTSILLGQTETDANGFIGSPDVVGQTDIRFDHGDWTVNWSIFAIGKQSMAENTDPISHSTLYPNPNYRKADAEFTAYHSLAVRKKFDKFELTLGVKNIFDDAPPAVSNTWSTFGRSVLSSQYDYQGRTGFFELDKKF